MKIAFDKSLPPKAGDFGDVSDTELHVPLDYRSVFLTFGIRTADTLHDIAVSAPDVLAKALHWTEAEVAQANAELIEHLTKLGRIHPDADKIDPSELGLGAGPVFNIRK